MTDESKTAAPGGSAHVNHYCSIDRCGRWGGFGFAKAGRGDPVWWCWEHYPHKPNQAKHDAAEIAAAIVFDP